MRLKPSSFVSPEAIYDDQLENSWQDWSWPNKLKSLSGGNPYRGNNNIVWIPDGNSGLYLSKPPHVTRNVGGFVALTFAIQATGPLNVNASGQAFMVELYDTQDPPQPMPNAKALANYGGDPPVGSYQVYAIPLQALLGVNNPVITGFAIKNVTLTPQPDVYVDEIGLV